MSALIDELARSLARPMPRRTALRLVAGSVVGLAIGGLRPPRAFARRGSCGPGALECGGSELDCYRPGLDTCCPNRPPADAIGSDVAIGVPDAVCCWDERGNANPLPPEWSCCGDTQPCPPRRKCCGDKCCPSGLECVRGECAKVCERETGRGVSRVYDPKTQCCTEYGIEPKYPIRYFGRCEKTRVARPGFKPSSNGCGPEGGPKVPDQFGKASFLKACTTHDLCYDRCRSDRAKCDEAFCKQLRNACAKAYPKAKSKMRKRCDNRAKDYCDAVTALGSIAYAAAQSKACQCCP